MLRRFGLLAQSDTPSHLKKALKYQRTIVTLEKDKDLEDNQITEFFIPDLEICVNSAGKAFFSSAPKDPESKYIRVLLTADFARKAQALAKASHSLEKAKNELLLDYEIHCLFNEDDDSIRPFTESYYSDTETTTDDTDYSYDSDEAWSDQEPPTPPDVKVGIRYTKGIQGEKDFETGFFIPCGKICFNLNGHAFFLENTQNEQKKSELSTQTVLEEFVDVDLDSEPDSPAMDCSPETETYIPLELYKKIKHVAECDAKVKQTKETLQSDENFQQECQRNEIHTKPSRCIVS